MSIVLIMMGAFEQDRETAIFGISGHIVTTALFYFIHEPHGLIFGTSSNDALQHFGIIKDTMASGSLIETQTYPAFHGFMSVIMYVTTLPDQLYVPLLSFMFYVFFLTSMFTLGRSELGEWGGYIVVAAATPFIFGPEFRYINPWFIGTLLIPITILIYELRISSPQQNRSSLLALFVLIMGVISIHPMSGIYLIMSAGAWWGGNTLFRYSNNMELDIKTTIYPIVFAAIVGLVWTYVHNALFERVASILLVNFIPMEESERSSSGGESVATIFISAFEDSPASAAILFNEVVITEYGAAILYLMVSGVSLLIIVQKWPNNKKMGLTSMSGFVLGLTMAVLFFILYVVAADPLRVSAVAILFSVLAIGHLMHTIYNSNPTGANILIIFVVIIALVISLGMVYTPNSHTHKSTLEGVEWSYEYQNMEKPTETHLDRKISIYTIGIEEMRDRHEKVINFHRYDPPKHLGYDNVSSAADRMNESRYIVLQKRDFNRHKAYSQVRWDGFDWLITKEDRENLNNDTTSEKIYHAPHYETWYIATD